ncbi:MAG: helix-turn-helix domain-containing protein [Nanoarchaeota archaeon]
MIYPQEIEVWYILPLIRKELAKELLKYNLTQKEIALKLGLTESAISQYINQKRANNLVLYKEIKEEIENSAKRIANNSNSMKEIQNISKLFWETKGICKIHSQYDKSISKKCNVCFEK